MKILTNKRVIISAVLAALALPLISGQVFAQTGIPIGDGNISSSPEVGNVFSCQQQFNSNAPGAQASGDWFDGTYWYPELKPVVDGAVSWANSGIDMALTATTRTITSSNLPTHTTGVYPVSRNDDVYQYDRNPNTISAQSIRLSFAANPEIASTPSCVPMGMIGIALTGGAIYNAVDARGDDAPAHELQDSCGGHPQRNGQYHYHSVSNCMDEIGSMANGHSGLVGYALDGFGIYGLSGSGGHALENSDLDNCHGHTETIIWDGVSKDMYHYHLTQEYPYTVGCFVGTPVAN